MTQPVADASLPNSPFLRIAVLGAGTMGHGIAHAAALALASHGGSANAASVCLFDIDAVALARAIANVSANLDAGVARGKLSASARDGALAILRTSTVLADAVHGADLVIEAVPERVELKRQLLAAAAAAAPTTCVFATNTSSIPLRKLVSALPDATRFCGLHFFNPVHIQKLVEVVQAADTGVATLDAAVAFARFMGKEPIVVRDVAGFASSRLGLILGLEAIRMLEEGVASAADIDKAMSLGYRHPMGPLALTDLIGLDVRLAIAETLALEIDPVRFAPPALLRELVAAGKLGRKSGEGFYRYDEG